MTIVLPVSGSTDITGHFNIDVGSDCTSYRHYGDAPTYVLP